MSDTANQETGQEERPVQHNTRVPDDVIDQNLPPALLVTLVRLYRLADWATGTVRFGV